MESIILDTPILVILYSVVMLICIFDLNKRASGYIFPILSAVIFVFTTMYAIFLGAGHEEVGAVALIYLALNLRVYIRNMGDKK